MAIKNIGPPKSTRQTVMRQKENVRRERRRVRRHSPVRIKKTTKESRGCDSLRGNVCAAVTRVEFKEKEGVSAAEPRPFAPEGVAAPRSLSVGGHGVSAEAAYS